jgi:hypothetical protein
MFRRLCALIALATVFSAIPAWAAQLSRPQVEYSADATIQNEEGTIQQHVYATPTKERKEMLTGAGDVTFEVPVNLTRLSPDLSKVAVTCMFGTTIDQNIGTTSFGKDVLSNRMEFPVSAGQVVTTARVVIAVPTTPLYKPGQVLNYQCALSALSADPKAGSGWQPLDQKAPVASLQVSPSPLPVTGTFTW